MQGVSSVEGTLFLRINLQKYILEEFYGTRVTSRF